jgi:hypothetical protein
MITAEVICDSISTEGPKKRITTFQLRYPKFIHGEFMTHRVISRNASSSRAIPTAKLLEEVRDDALRASFVFWGKNQSGMQAAAELEGANLQLVQYHWAGAAQDAAWHAEKMLEAGAHKQLVNRLLEPFSHINVVATATEWDNFFGLRLHKDAQPEMRYLANEMWKSMKSSKPVELLPGMWHLPFVTLSPEEHNFGPAHDYDRAIKVSVARCARVSYQSHETGKESTWAEDLDLYTNKLHLDKGGKGFPIHASPAEHQATPDWLVEGGWSSPNQHGNFVGWRQYRKTLKGEAVAPLPEGYNG